MYYIGKITNTHGIKGEVKILSDIKHKELVFKKNQELIIDNDTLIINTYRTHKNYDMVTFVNINDINDVLKYKGKSVYAKLEKSENIMFKEDYIGMNIYTDKKIGEVIDIVNNGAQDLLVIKYNDKTHYIPNVDSFIKKIDNKNKIIYINLIEGLLDED